MKKEIISQSKYELREENDKLVFFFPINSEGSINLIIDKPCTIEMNLAENASWKFNVEINELKGDVIFNASLLDYASLQNSFVVYENNQNINFKKHVKVASSASFSESLLDVSNANVSFDGEINLDGVYGESYFRLAVISNLESEKSYIVKVNNNADNTTSKMDNYGVCRDASSLTFKGVGKINQGFKDSKNHQNSKIIVFDEKCKASILPLLLIDEYDVLASHSAAVGKVNEDHLYYLCSRGLSEKEAKEFITMGYLLPATNYFADEKMKEKATKLLERRVFNAGY